MRRPSGMGQTLWTLDTFMRPFLFNSNISSTMPRVRANPSSIDSNPSAFISSTIFRPLEWSMEFHEVERLYIVCLPLLVYINFDVRLRIEIEFYYPLYILRRDSVDPCVIMKNIIVPQSIELVQRHLERY